MRRQKRWRMKSAALGHLDADVIGPLDEGDFHSRAYLPWFANPLGALFGQLFLRLVHVVDQKPEMVQPIAGIGARAHRVFPLRPARDEEHHAVQVHVERWGAAQLSFLHDGGAEHVDPEITGGVRVFTPEVKVVV